MHMINMYIYNNIISYIYIYIYCKRALSPPNARRGTLTCFASGALIPKGLHDVARL